ncbi:hypothetical protein Gotur_005032 [Gossypium turneri]
MVDSIGEAVKGDRITGNDACLRIPPREVQQSFSGSSDLDLKNGSFDPGMEHAWMLALQKGDEGNRRPFVFHFLRSKSVSGNIVVMVDKITTLSSCLTPMHRTCIGLALQKGDEANRSIPSSDIIEKITTPWSQPDANASNMHQFQHYKKVMKVQCRGNIVVK